MKKIVPIIPIFFLVLITTFIKGSTKKIEKEIFNTKEEIRILNDQYELILLEHNYLTSPENLFNYQRKFFDKELDMIEIENISSMKFDNNKIKIKKLIEKSKDE